MKFQFKSIIHSFVACLCYLHILAIFFGSVSGVAQSSALQSKYDQKKSEIQNQINAINGQISGLTGNIHETENRKASLQEQITVMKQEIAKTEALITQTKLAVSALEGQIEENNKRIQELNNEMRELVKEIQRQEKTSPIEAILSSKSLSEAVSNLYNLTTLEDRAGELNTKLDETAKELAINKTKQEEVQKSLEGQQFLLNSKNDELNTLLRETEAEQSKYEALLKASQDQKKQSEGLFVAVDGEYKAEIEKELAAKRSTNNWYSGNSGNDFGYAENGGGCRFTDRRALSAPSGYFIRPTKAYVSQNYWCGGGGHDGWDMANSTGTPIVAVAAGRVVQKGFHAGGFGNYAVIRHDLPSGQRVYSLYAHMQSPAIASGTVSQGQQVGSMGTSGLSTGPHLHFMLISDTFETNGVGCMYGSSKCYDPATFL
jgi:murein DD-endopeptidase MepM/ murein hydrolase activator NlpD